MTMGKKSASTGKEQLQFTKCIKVTCDHDNGIYMEWKESLNVTRDDDDIWTS